MVAGRVEKIATFGGVEVEEDAWNDCAEMVLVSIWMSDLGKEGEILLRGGERERPTNNLLLQTLLKEIQSIIDLLGQMTEIQPDIERRVRHILD